MKQITRNEYIKLLKQLAVSTCPIKPIIITGKAFIGKAGIAKDTLGDDLCITVGDPKEGHKQLYVDGKYVKVKEHPELQGFWMNTCVAESNAHVIMYDRSLARCTKRDFDWTLWLQEEIKKPVIVNMSINNRNEIPTNLEDCFDVYELILDRDSWLEWATSKDEKGIQVVDPIITDYIANSDENIWWPEGFNKSAADKWYLFSNHYRFLISEMITEESIEYAKEELLFDSNKMNTNVLEVNDANTLALLGVVIKIYNQCHGPFAKDFVTNFCNYYNLGQYLTNFDEWE